MHQNKKYQNSVKFSNVNLNNVFKFTSNSGLLEKLKIKILWLSTKCVLKANLRLWKFIHREKYLETFFSLPFTILNLADTWSTFVLAASNEIQLSRKSSKKFSNRKVFKNFMQTSNKVCFHSLGSFIPSMKSNSRLNKKFCEKFER